MINPVISDFGKRLRALRELKGYTRTQLAQRANVTPYSIEAWEMGYVKMPGADKVVKLALALGTTPERLVDPPRGVPDPLRRVPLDELMKAQGIEGPQGLEAISDPNWDDQDPQSRAFSKALEVPVKPTDCWMKIRFPEGLDHREDFGEVLHEALTKDPLLSFLDLGVSIAVAAEEVEHPAEHVEVSFTLDDLTYLPDVIRVVRSVLPERAEIDLQFELSQESFILPRRLAHPKEPTHE